MIWTNKKQCQFVYMLFLICLFCMIPIYLFHKKDVTNLHLKQQTYLSKKSSYNETVVSLWKDPFKTKQDIPIKEFPKPNGGIKEKMLLRGISFYDGKYNAVMEFNNRQNVYQEMDHVSDFLILSINSNEVVLVGQDKMLKIALTNQNEEMMFNSKSLQERTINKHSFKRPVLYWRKVLQEIKPLPFFESGMPIGYLLTNVGRDHFLRKAGLKNGDVVKSINGHRLVSLEDIKDVYSELVDKDKIVLSLRRDSKEIKVIYYLEG